VVCVSVCGEVGWGGEQFVCVYVWCVRVCVCVCVCVFGTMC